MKTEDLKWSKTKVQCPYCDNWYTKQGILGHIRFRHPDRKKKETDAMRDILKDQYYNTYIDALKMFRDQGRLTPQYREFLLDMMLLDYLRGLSQREK